MQKSNTNSSCRRVIGQWGSVGVQFALSCKLQVALEQQSCRQTLPPTHTMFQWRLGDMPLNNNKLLGVPARRSSNSHVRVNCGGSARSEMRDMMNFGVKCDKCELAFAVPRKKWMEIKMCNSQGKQTQPWLSLILFRQARGKQKIVAKTTRHDCIRKKLRFCNTLIILQLRCWNINTFSQTRICLKIQITSFWKARSFSLKIFIFSFFGYAVPQSKFYAKKPKYLDNWFNSDWPILNCGIRISGHDVVFLFNCFFLTY